MHLAPHPSWYLFDADGPMPLRLLTDDGQADPSLNATPHGPLAALTEALHKDSLGAAQPASSNPWAHPGTLT